MFVPELIDVIADATGVRAVRILAFAKALRRAGVLPTRRGAAALPVSHPEAAAILAALMITPDARASAEPALEMLATPVDRAAPSFAAALGLAEVHTFEAALVALLRRLPDAPGAVEIEGVEYVNAEVVMFEYSKSARIALNGMVAEYRQAFDGVEYRRAIDAAVAATEAGNEDEAGRILAAASIPRRFPALRVARTLTAEPLMRIAEALAADAAERGAA